MKSLQGNLMAIRSWGKRRQREIERQQAVEYRELFPGTCQKVETKEGSQVGRPEENSAQKGWHAEAWDWLNWQVQGAKGTPTNQGIWTGP
jgi:hypothetical protein